MQQRVVLASAFSVGESRHASELGLALRRDVGSETVEADLHFLINDDLSSVGGSHLEELWTSS